MADVKAHPWFNGPTCTLGDVQDEFAQRKHRIDLDNESKRQEKIAEKVQRSEGVAA
jgi:hypothetical protein